MRRRRARKSSGENKKWGRSASVWDGHVVRSGSNSRGDRLLRERRACAQRYAHRCRGLAPYRHRQQQYAGAMGMEDMKEEGMVHMTVFTITSPP